MLLGRKQLNSKSSFSGTKTNLTLIPSSSFYSSKNLWFQKTQGRLRRSLPTSNPIFVPKANIFDFWKKDKKEEKKEEKESEEANKPSSTTTEEKPQAKAQEKPTPTADTNAKTQPTSTPKKKKEIDIASLDTPSFASPPSVLPTFSSHLFQYPGEEKFRLRPLTVPVHNLKGQVVANIQIASEIFDVPIRRDLLQRIVVWQLAKRRQGTAKKKDRSEVSGGGRKIRPQKKTGSARAGSIRAPHWRHGGRCHGPVQRDFGFALPKKVRRQGLRTLLSTKLAEGNLVIVNSAELPSHKTSFLSNVLDPLGWGASSLIITGRSVDPNLDLASRNIQTVDVFSNLGLNVYDGLRREKLILTKEAVGLLHARLMSPLSPWQLNELQGKTSPPVASSTN
eukprot:TRINITY_DN844_c0_g1_i2.p1 TRINITY_DN844_c0_g1~~TRINITY_DN844_c0_g1_i2.p1  ORF type:complete len:393 (-),score=126.75 TRINITY_DN844_c0_g1_i2:160-1338(-)